MQFQLSRNNREQPDEALLEDLRAASASLRGRKLSREFYAKVGRFAASTVANRFGGWGKALVRAGLTPPRHFAVTAAEVIADVQRVANELGVRVLPFATYLKHGRYSPNPVRRHFGKSWVQVLQGAGLSVSRQYHPRTTDEALLENLERVWRELGRQPTVNDMTPPRSAYSADTYKRRFGGWRKALEVFVAASGESGDGAATDQGRDEEAMRDQESRAHPPIGEQRLPVVRSVGWRLRYTVMLRDHFRCRACGRSPAIQPGTVLHVDHVVPWSKGGPTAEANLQTLCEECNIGKGA